MKKYLILGILIAVLTVSAGLVAAGPGNGRAKVTLPEHAVEVAPGIFYLGSTIHHGRLVEGYAMFAKPYCGDGKCTGQENEITCPEDCAAAPEEPGSDCYAFLGNGVKWKTIEPWIVNPTNTRGLASDFVLTNLGVDIDKWETAASFDILGSGSSTNETLVADMDSPDDKNEVYFADIDSQGAIGVTIVWGYFRGPPSTRELVEWDQVYDDYDFDWSSTGEAGKMDFENIATHELGHSCGLADLYDDVCSEQTMYGYADYGETKKQTLEAGDIAGIQALY